MTEREQRAAVVRAACEAANSFRRRAPDESWIRSSYDENINENKEFPGNSYDVYAAALRRALEISQEVSRAYCAAWNDYSEDDRLDDPDYYEGGARREAMRLAVPDGVRGHFESIFCVESMEES